MKQFFLPLVVILFMTSMSCKQAEVAVVIPTSLFKAAVVKHPVQDYAKFKTVFASSDSMVLANGFHPIGVARGIQDTNTVVVIGKLDDVAKAKAFFTSPEIKMAMDSAGVNGPVTIDYVDVLRNDDSDIPQMERMSIKHHVKDFATWLKVYDQEGKEARANYGMIDRALARGVDDSNMVYLVFAITDMAKAMEHGQSPELKKLLEESGVDSEPEMFAYKFDVYKEK
jgi:quinol monooxygenase YgiN